MTDLSKLLLGSFGLMAALFVFEMLNSKLNLKRQVRSRQFLMPVIALIFCIVIAVEQIKLFGLVEKLLDFLSQYLEKDSSIYLWIRRNLLTIVFYAANVLALLAWSVVKRVLASLLGGLFAPAQRDNWFTRAMASFHAAAAGPFYEKTESGERWFLRRDSLQARTFLRVLTVTAFLLTWVGIVVTKTLYQKDVLTSLWLPVSLLILVGELYFFCDGAEAEQGEREGEADDADSVIDYSLMRRVLRKLFPDKLSTEDTTVDDSAPDISGLTELMDSLRISSDGSEQAYGVFLQRQADAGTEIDTNYAVSGRRLLRGESVLFNNPFQYDLIPYVPYVMNRTLLRHKKVLIILGRHGAEEEAKNWVETGIREVTHIADLWKIGVLTKETANPDVGIITRSEVNQMNVHEANLAFFAETELVILLEPSLLMTTAQIGLNSIVRCCRSRAGKKLVYCSIDKNCDGLLDALSHVLMTSLTEVQATGHHTGVSSYMCWDGDSDHMQHRLLPNLSRYLGFGTELSFAALKNGIGQAGWYGGSAFPVTDVRWIAGQYYYDLMHYAGLPAKQSEMDRVFRVSPDMWSARVAENSYLTVEDECCNLFEVKRNYATRAKKQGFVNVISPAYLLKDYMTDNDSIFNADSKAIPCLAADYSHTVRNVVLRLCLRMSSAPVPEKEVVRELLMVDAGTEKPADELWNLIIREFGIRDYHALDENECPILSCICGDKEYIFKRVMLQTKRKFCFESGEMENQYFIRNDDFERIVLDSLKNAEYIAEQEDGSKKYLGTEVLGHIFQRYLPGQFFTFHGKYYEMLRATGDGRVLVRRAADHIHGRPVYRQVRNYTLTNMVQSPLMGDTKEKGAVSVSRQFADIQAETTAYWELKDYNDFESGRYVKVNGIPVRSYLNKSMLMVRIRSALATPAVMSTLALLIEEVLRTLLAENACYAAIVTPYEARLPVLNQVKGENGVRLEENCLCIIEDSQLDIGILDTIERNLDRILNIVCDYLLWNEEAIEKSRSVPPEPEPEVPAPETEPDSEGDQKKKKGIFARIRDWFKKLFGKKKQAVPEAAASPEETSEETPEETPEEASEDLPEESPEESSEASSEEAPEASPADDSAVRPDDNAAEVYVSHADEEAPQAGGTTLEFEPEQVVSGELSIGRKPYHERYYLRYGGCAGAEQLDIPGVIALLKELRYDQNFLRAAREGKNLAEQIADGSNCMDAGEHVCDFCGRTITGAEFERLKDGRERCTECGKTAVRNLKEFENMYHTIVRDLKRFYGVSIDVPVRIKMVNAKKLHKALGKTFIPTGGFDGRTLGVAIQNGDGYFILMENGAPRLMSMMTMIHEMTHIWQYTHWNGSEIRGRYGDLELEVYEGMAKWVEVQYAYLLRETSYAMLHELSTAARDDAYGRGFVKYRKKYPLRKSAAEDGRTPFEYSRAPM